MDFLIDKNKKKELVKTIIEKNRYVRKMHDFAHTMFVISIAEIAAYIFLALINNLSWFEAIESSLYTFLILFTIGYLCNGFAHRIAGENILDRVDEKITIQSDELIYSFRDRYLTDAKDRIRIYIPFKNINDIQYKECCNKILLTGDFTKRNVEKCGADTMPPQRGKIVKETKIEEFVFFDYFEPSLYEYIKNREQS